MFGLILGLLSKDILGTYTWGWMKVRGNPSSYDYLEYARQYLSEGYVSRH